MPFVVTWMQLEITTLSEVSEKERQMPYDITYMQNLNMAQMNLSIKQKQTHRWREQTAKEEGRGKKDREFGITRCK